MQSTTKSTTKLNDNQKQIFWEGESYKQKTNTVKKGFKITKKQNVINCFCKLFEKKNNNKGHEVIRVAYL